MKQITSIFETDHLVIRSSQLLWHRSFGYQIISATLKKVITALEADHMSSELLWNRELLSLKQIIRSSDNQNCFETWTGEPFQQDVNNNAHPNFCRKSRGLLLLLESGGQGAGGQCGLRWWRGSHSSSQSVNVDYFSFWLYSCIYLAKPGNL